MFAEGMSVAQIAAEVYPKDAAVTGEMKVRALLGQWVELKHGLAADAAAGENRPLVAVLRCFFDENAVRDMLRTARGDVDLLDLPSIDDGTIGLLAKPGALSIGTESLEATDLEHIQKLIHAIISLHLQSTSKSSSTPSSRCICRESPSMCSARPKGTISLRSTPT